MPSFLLIVEVLARLYSELLQLGEGAGLLEDSISVLEYTGRWSIY